MSQSTNDREESWSIELHGNFIGAWMDKDLTGIIHVLIKYNYRLTASA